MKAGVVTLFTLVATISYSQYHVTYTSDASSGTHWASGGTTPYSAIGLGYGGDNVIFSQPPPGLGYPEATISGEISIDINWTGSPRSLPKAIVIVLSSTARSSTMSHGAGDIVYLGSVDNDKPGSQHFGSNGIQSYTYDGSDTWLPVGVRHQYYQIITNPDSSYNFTIDPTAETSWSQSSMGQKKCGIAEVYVEARVFELDPLYTTTGVVLAGQRYYLPGQQLIAEANNGLVSKGWQVNVSWYNSSNTLFSDFYAESSQSQVSAFSPHSGQYFSAYINNVSKPEHKIEVILSPPSYAVGANPYISGNPLEIVKAINV